MLTISIEEMQRDLPGYLRRVEVGETITVTQADRPIAEIKPVEETKLDKANSGQLRPIGLAAGEFVVPDSFDDPLPEEILREFEGR